MPTALASHTRLRPGSNIVVPILSPGHAPETQASPTSGSGPGRDSTSGSHSESNPVSRIACANATMASGPRLSPPALIPIRTFTASPATARRSPRCDPAVVDVAVRDEADDLRRDGMGQHAVALQVGQQLVGVARA